MKRVFCVFLVLVLVVGGAFASKKKDDGARLHAIWQFMEDRLTHQTDVWFDAGDYPSTVTLLRFMNKEDPADYEYATNLGWMLENEDQYGDALVTYVRFLKDNPTQPDAPFPEANFYFQKKAYSKVPPLLENSIAERPHPNSYRLLAHSYEKLGLYADAVKVWKQLVEDHPEDPAAKRNLKKDEAQLAAPAQKSTDQIGGKS